MSPKNKDHGRVTSKGRYVKAIPLEAEDDEEDYRKKRDRNNQAVKRSRVKSRLRTQETMERVQKLRTENDMLEEKIKILSKELGFLKDLFLAHASSSQSAYLEDIDLGSLLNDTTNTLMSIGHKDDSSN